MRAEIEAGRLYHIRSDRNDWTGSDLPRSEKVRDLGKSDSV